VFRLGVILAAIGASLGIAGMACAAYWILTHLE
jgi:hypothetical protein